MIENQIGKRFAEALSDAIEEDAGLSPALDTLTAIRDSFQTDPTLYRFFIHPTYPEDRKQALVEELCNRFNAPAPVRNLMRMLVHRQKMPFVKNIAGYFQDVVDQRLNRVRVRVVSAYSLGQDELKKLKTSLDRQLGKNAILEPLVDENVIGGIRLVVGSQVADATVQNRLAQLKHAIRNEEALSEFASG